MRRVGRRHCILASAKMVEHKKHHLVGKYCKLCIEWICRSWSQFSANDNRFVALTSSADAQMCMPNLIVSTTTTTTTTMTTTEPITLPLAQSRGVKMEGRIGLSTRDYTHLAARCSVGTTVGLKPALCALSNQLENSNSLLFCLFSQ